MVSYEKARAGIETFVLVHPGFQYFFFFFCGLAAFGRGRHPVLLAPPKNALRRWSGTRVLRVILVYEAYSLITFCWSSVSVDLVEALVLAVFP